MSNRFFRLSPLMKNILATYIHSKFALKKYCYEVKLCISVTRHQHHGYCSSMASSRVGAKWYLVLVEFPHHSIKPLAAAYRRTVGVSEPMEVGHRDQPLLVINVSDKRLICADDSRSNTGYLLRETRHARYALGDLP